MNDPVSSMKQVVQVALKIKEAADTVRHNKEVCHQIRGRVNRLRSILSKLEDSDSVNDPVTTNVLNDLEETLHRAYSLVVACQEEKNIVSILFTARKLSRKLRQVNEDILAQMAVASFGNNVETTIMVTKHFQDLPKEQEQVGLASLFHEDAEDVVSSSGTHSHHDARLEESDESGRVSEVQEPSGIPKMPHAALPWFIIFTYSQLRYATNKFSSVLGRGHNGTVYKGVLRDGREVAVKQISIDSPGCKADCENEVRFTAMLQHVNVLKLIGCCSTKRESFLVYELMQNGTLRDHIHGNKRDSVFPWPVRFQIVEGIAQGLLYLHKECGLRIIHLDIKPANILLDDCYIPKIANFGSSLTLSQFADEEETDWVTGTQGFLDPDYLSTFRFSAKTDVYSYGVLLLETISGMANLQAGREFNTQIAWAWHLWKKGKLAEFIDPVVRGVADVSETKEMKRCIHIALVCVELNPAHRPTVSDILEMMQDKKLKLPIPQQPAYTNEDSSDNKEID